MRISKLRKIIREEIQKLNEFREDPKRGLGSDYKSIAKDAEKVSKIDVKNGPKFMRKWDQESMIF